MKNRYLAKIKYILVEESRIYDWFIKIFEFYFYSIKKGLVLENYDFFSKAYSKTGPKNSKLLSIFQSIDIWREGPTTPYTTTNTRHTNTKRYQLVLLLLHP